MFSKLCYYVFLIKKNYSRPDASLPLSLLFAMRDPNWNARFGSSAA